MSASCCWRASGGRREGQKVGPLKSWSLRHNDASAPNHTAALAFLQPSPQTWFAGAANFLEDRRRVGLLSQASLRRCHIPLHSSWAPPAPHAGLHPKEDACLENPGPRAKSLENRRKLRRTRSLVRSPAASSIPDAGMAEV